MVVASAALLVVGLLGWWVLETQQAGVPVRPAAAASKTRPQGDHYVVTVGAEPRHLNPLLAVDTVPFAVLSKTHDALVETDPHTGETALTLLVSAEAEPDGRAFVVTLRDGIRFSDGQPLTMDDVWFTWELARAPYELPGAMWAGLRDLESVEKLDSRQLRLVVKERHFSGLASVGKSFLVVQRRYFEDQVRAVAERLGKPAPTGPEDPFFGECLLELELPGPGTGPYQLARAKGTGELMWRRGQSVLLTQNPYSWRAAVYPDLWNLAGIKLLFEADSAARRALLRQQKIDWLDVVDAHATLRADPELERHYRAYDYGHRQMGPAFVIWNHKHPALSEARVRKALTMLFDRDSLIEERGLRAQPAGSWFAPDSPQAGGMAPLPHNIAGAGKLLREAGWGEGGKPLELTVIAMAAPDSEWEQVIDVAIPTFAQAGVTLKKNVLELSVLSERLAAGSFDGLVYAWAPDVFNDPTEIFHSTLATNNWMGYRNPAMDRVLESARVELDLTKRIELYRRFNEILAEDQPITLLYHRRMSALLHRRFRGVELGALGLTPHRWWVEPDEQRYR